MKFDDTTALDVSENAEPLDELTDENSAELKECDPQKTKRKRGSAKKKSNDTAVAETAKKEPFDAEISAESDSDELEKASAVQPETEEVTEEPAAVETNAAEIKYETGSAIALPRKIRLYASSVSPKNKGFINGMVYVWAEKVCSSRIRISDTAKGAGKMMHLLGWISLSDIQQ